MNEKECWEKKRERILDIMGYIERNSDSYKTGYKEGKIFMRNEILEDLKKIDDLIFDKTDYYTTLKLRKLIEKYKKRII